MASGTPRLVETLRKPVSRLAALGFLAVALFHRPLALPLVWLEVAQNVGYLLLILAALGRMWAYVHIGGRKNQELCTSGPYAFCRNPLYLFSFLGVCGAALALRDPVLWIGTPVLFLAYYAIVIRAEEGRLAELFGPAFATYCATVPRFWPRSLKLDDAGELRVPAALFRRTLGEVFWFLAAIVLVEIITALKAQAWWWTF